MGSRGPWQIHLCPSCLADGSLRRGASSTGKIGWPGSDWFASSHTANSEADCERASWCTWIYVRTDDDREGWVLSDYLRWGQGEAPPDSGD